MSPVSRDSEVSPACRPPNAAYRRHVIDMSISATCSDAARHSPSLSAAMAIPTFLIGLLPGYQTIGVLAPVGLTFLRVVQGLSVGGEYAGSMVFLVEHAPEGRRGLMGALAASGSSVGMLLGSAVGAAFAASMSTAALDAWGYGAILPAGAHRQGRRLHPSPVRARNGSRGKAHSRSHRRTFTITGVWLQASSVYRSTAP